MSEIDIDTLRNSATSVWGGIVIVISVGFAAFSRFTRFKEDVLIPKLINRYVRLNSSLGEDSELFGAIHSAIEEEAFKVLFYHRGTKKYRNSLLMLYKSGDFSLSELQGAGRSLDVKKGKIVSTYGWFEKVGIYLHVVLLVLVALFFSNYLVIVISKGTLASWIAAAIIIALFIAILLPLLSVLFQLLNCRKVARKLDERIDRKRQKKQRNEVILSKSSADQLNPIRES